MALSFTKKISSSTRWTIISILVLALGSCSIVIVSTYSSCAFKYNWWQCKSALWLLFSWYLTFYAVDYCVKWNKIIKTVIYYKHGWILPVEWFYYLSILTRNTIGWIADLHTLLFVLLTIIIIISYQLLSIIGKISLPFVVLSTSLVSYIYINSALKNYVKMH